MASFLQRVLEVKRREIREDRDYIKHLEKLIEKRERHYDFPSALRSCRTKIIAEVKKASPSAGHIRSVKPSEQAKLYESAGAVAISVLTDREFFGGSLEDLREVREAVSLPILRKDFIIHRVQVLEAKAFGADTLLLIVRILSPEELGGLIGFSRELGLEPLVEVFSLEEAKVALDAGAQVLGINNRDLDTLRVDVNLTKELAPKVKELGAEFVIAESGIETREQIEELTNYNVDAFLIGTALMKSEDPYSKLKELLGFPCDR
ncbi:indole-3-glycerol phosphate synthase TrpC [Hydrogenivirga sp. 128-5-R1-1]|uniref:indole-3-glycerol phosphate synthase TrpC n=1 Tax=Hydrogenivirga sp. 128-5-R1-1 TaxID=392423 RepID=UPI00015F360E|nr:indole-3-glycerol phosphate synthase TrpC [Hydrogenivirga sp. 128-5-R1-1]EDP76536.1 indole-3-glycerol phosphate synthase [Hydrogenivirga sp. 128-5-R1-1]